MKPSWVHYSMFHYSWCFPLWLLESGNILGSVWISGTVPFHCFGLLLSLILGSFLTCMCQSVLNQILKGDFLISRVLSLHIALFFDVLSCEFYLFCSPHTLNLPLQLRLARIPLPEPQSGTLLMLWVREIVRFTLFIPFP